VLDLKNSTLKGDFMICPVRCFSCGQVVADKYDEYKRLIDQEKKTPEQALDQLGLRKYCCRRMLLTHTDIIEDVIKY
jgi:DNA-directed RNA polymerase subunit N (RpoN/RPB10)